MFVFNVCVQYLFVFNAEQTAELIKECGSASESSRHQSTGSLFLNTNTKIHKEEKQTNISDKVPVVVENVEQESMEAVRVNKVNHIF